MPAGAQKPLGSVRPCCCTCAPRRCGTAGSSKQYSWMKSATGSKSAASQVAVVCVLMSGDVLRKGVRKSAAS